MTLPETFDVTTVRAWHQQLVSALADGLLTIDASQVQRADAAAMQLLAAAAVEARHQGRTLDVTAPSPVFTAAATTLGLGDHLLSTH